MNSEQPFALLITWTCYGTWLPGDPRGHVSDTLQPGGSRLPKRNTPGTPYATGDEYTLLEAQQRQKWPMVHLTRDQAQAVVERMVEAAEERHWRILRAAVMCHHVHVVVTDCPDDGPAVRRVLKGTTQARLSERAAAPCRWWTKKGSDRYLHTEEAIENAVRYVARQKGILAEVVDMQVV
ncbi:MAG TPA: hypothetical protein VMY42_16100 [Thermoguttaceae bacterium]|nr:hypothetical protein [Thermoguttaceae bacterium]